jgi:serine/threonine protein kinase
MTITVTSITKGEQLRHTTNYVRDLYEGTCIVENKTIRDEKETIFRPCFLLQQGHYRDNLYDYYHLLMKHSRDCYHKNLIKLIDVKDNYIIFEHPGKSLFEYILEGHKFSDVNKKFIIQQLADALAHLENIKMYHRYLNPHNIFINPETFVVKLFDFGIDYHDRVPRNWCRVESEYNRLLLPETLRESLESAEKDDVWCFGLIIYGLILDDSVNCQNFKYSATDHNTKYTLYPRTPVELSRIEDFNLRSVIQKCLTWRNQRPTMWDIKELLKKIC